MRYPLRLQQVQIRVFQTLAAKAIFGKPATQGGFCFGVFHAVI